MIKREVEAKLQTYQSTDDREKFTLPIDVDDWQQKAKSVLDRDPYDYVESGAGREETLKRNRMAFSEWEIQPQLLNNVAGRDIQISLFGQKLNHPVLLAPVGNQSIVHPKADLASAGAAATTGTPYITSTVSSYPLEEIAEVMGERRRWFQLYWSKDRDVTVSMIQRAEAAGYTAIVVTIDSPMLGWRQKDHFNGYFPLQLGHGIANYVTDPVFCEKLGFEPEEDLDAAIQLVLENVFKPDLTWDDLDFIKQHTKLPILLKGILHPADAERAINYGADGIVVSNHGGRQLDGCTPTLKVLPEIRDRLPVEYPVLLDSGVRSGPDVVKSLALGADAVLIGRPYIYGLATGGEAGVKKVIDNLVADIDITMALSGKKAIGELDRSLLCKI